MILDKLKLCFACTDNAVGTSETPASVRYFVTRENEVAPATKY